MVNGARCLRTGALVSEHRVELVDEQTADDEVRAASKLAIGDVASGEWSFRHELDRLISIHGVSGQLLP